MPKNTITLCLWSFALLTSLLLSANAQSLIRFGSGTWTAVSGVMSGTFTKPMPTHDGKSIPPTGKHFALSMLTIGHWNGSTMEHEWLFWDNQDFINQIGLGK